MYPSLQWSVFLKNIFVIKCSCHKQLSPKEPSYFYETICIEQFDEIAHEAEEQKEMAVNRLSELEKLQRDYQECLRECEQLRLDVSAIEYSLAK